MFQQYILQILDFLVEFGVAPMVSSIIAHAAIYGLLIYVVVAVIILIGKITKKYTIKKSNLGIFSAFYFFFFVVAVSCFIPAYQKAILEPWGGIIPYITTMIGGIIQEPELSKKLLLLAMMLLMLLLLGVFVLLIFGGLYGFWLTFQSTIQKNGLLMGIFVGIYEVFAGFFWLVMLLALFSIGVAIVILPLLIVMANHKIVYVEETD